MVKANDSILVESLQNQLDVALESLGLAFEESAHIKKGIMAYVSHCREMYCEQIQKFSVLAYDYLERIELISKRE